MADDELTPEARVRHAKLQRDEVAEGRPRVDALVAKLKRHLDENHFVERLYEQLTATRRNA
ncbi:DUF7620 family protein [Amycolatopsis sp. NPDC004772]